MAPKALIEHRAQGRARLRIADRRQDLRYFQSVCDALSRLEGVTAVHANPRTAGVLIEWQGAAPDFVAYGERQGLFQTTPDTDEPAELRAALTRGLRRLNRRVDELSHGRLDNKSLGFVSLAAFAALQLYRGAVLPPAMTLLLHALELIDGERGAVEPGKLSAGDPPSQAD